MTRLNYTRPDDRYPPLCDAVYDGHGLVGAESEAGQDGAVTGAGRVRQTQERAVSEDDWRLDGSGQQRQAARQRRRRRESCYVPPHFTHIRTVWRSGGVVRLVNEVCSPLSWVTVVVGGPAMVGRLFLPRTKRRQ